MIVTSDPNLMPARPSNRRKLVRVGRAMLFVVDQIILLGSQSLLD